MKRYEATTTIAAPADKIWEILLDTASWPEWDPYCERIEGEVALGNKIKAYSTLAPGRAFPVKVDTLDPGERMVWKGGMPLGLFKGVRSFLLEPTDDGTIEFTLQEVFSGPMLLLIGRTIPDMTEPFQAFVAGLKERAEAAATD